MEIHITYKLLDVDGTEMGGFQIFDYLVLWGIPEMGKPLKLKLNGVERIARVIECGSQQVGDSLWSAWATAQLENE
jgi:hypothetical protein